MLLTPFFKISLQFPSLCYIRKLKGKVVGIFLTNACEMLKIGLLLQKKRSKILVVRKFVVHLHSLN